MKPEEILVRLQQQLGAATIVDSNLQTATTGVGGAGSGGGHAWVAVNAADFPKVAHFLKNDPQLHLTWLRSLTGLDYPDKNQLVVAYDLMSHDLGHEFCVKVFLPRDNPVLPTVSHVWRAAEWHEREAYDLFGIIFVGHPDSVTEDGVTHPRRILLPDDWQGFPLRKDYVFPVEYHGTPGTVELNWAQKAEYPK